MLPKRCNLGLFLILLVFTGCKQRTPELGNNDTSDETTVEVAVLSEADIASPKVTLVPGVARVEVAVLSEEAIASIRGTVEQCGGVLRLGKEGQPEAVDLAVERGSADKGGLLAAMECPRLKSLRIRGAGLTEEDLVGIASLVFLEELLLQDVPIQDELLTTWTEHLTSLRRLTLRNVSSVTSTECLVSLPRLTHLALIDMPIEVGAIAPLREAKNLVSLDLRMCGRLGGEQLAILAGIPKLKALKLGGYTIDNRSMAAVTTMPALASLTIEDASIDAKGLAALIPIGSRLRTLSLARCSGLGDDGLQAVEAFDGLRALVLRDMPVTGEFLQHIASPERLETLSLNQTFLMEEAVNAIVRCKHLKRLELAHNLLSLQAAEKISTLVDLEYLNLTACGLDAASLEPLKKLVNLKTLLVDGNSNVNEKTVQKILGITSVE